MNTQKVKTSWLKTMTAAFAAVLMAAGAHGAEKITVDEVSNHYPWDGKVDCVTTLSGLDTIDEYEGTFTLSVKKDGTKVSKVVTNAFVSADGTYTNTFDCSELFGAGFYPNGSIAVDLVKKESENEDTHGCVQLWKDGPYWAECNVGATKPEEYGYYFWWGDTVGYTNTGSAWISVNDGTTLSGDFSDGFSDSNCATYGKDNYALTLEGYIDSTENLVAAHDAATAYWGDQWRMPTSAEIEALVENCTTEWTTTNGVYGRLVTGKGDYATKSIFLPAAGYGNGSYLFSDGSDGYYWSSTPYSYVSYYAWGFLIDSYHFGWSYYNRSLGHSVRPLRTK